MQLLSLEERAERIFTYYHVTQEVRERYKRDWIRSVTSLGDKWLYAQFATRLTDEQRGAKAEDGTYRVTTGTTDAVSRSEPIPAQRGS